MRNKKNRVCIYTRVSGSARNKQLRSPPKLKLRSPALDSWFASFTTMSVDDQYSDILGGSSLPIRRDPGASQWSGLSFTIKTTFTLALVLVLYVASVQAWDWFLRWREQNYKL